MSNPIPRRNNAYGYPNASTALFPEPIRNALPPTVYDFNEIGTYWVDTTNSDLYFLLSISGGQANWYKITTSSGAGVFSSLTVNPGPVTTSGTGAVNISADAVATTVNVGTGAGVKAVTIGSTNTTSATTIQGGSGKVTISDNANVAGAITLSTNGGTTETIYLTNTLGNTSAAIRLTALAGGVTLVGNGDIPGAISIGANAGVSETVLINSAQGTGAASVDISSTAGGVTVSAATNLTLTGTTGIVLSGDLSLVAAGPKILSGAGSPDTVVTAPKGSFYLNTTGSGVADRAFINTDGATAWTAVTTAT